MLKEHNFNNASNQLEGEMLLHNLPNIFTGSPTWLTVK